MSLGTGKGQGEREKGKGKREKGEGRRQTKKKDVISDEVLGIRDSNVS
jgi:hypothetical protein